MKFYGYVGLAIIILSEILLFSGNQVAGRWFTPIVWSGYILFIDALVFRLTANSLLSTDRLEMLIILICSISVWWLFEFYNAPRFWQGGPEFWWHYHNLEPNPYLRRVGYDWAFATIFPGLFLTARLLLATVFNKRKTLPAFRVSRVVVCLVIAFGALGVVMPLLFISAWWAPVIWLAFVFLIDPINHLRGWPSIIGDLERGDYRRLFALLGSGLLCGILWELWNYWAISKWTYTVPYLGQIKIFEMPVLGYLGFPPFAVECWVTYIFLRSLLGVERTSMTNIWFSRHE